MIRCKVMLSLLMVFVLLIQTSQATLVSTMSSHSCRSPKVKVLAFDFDKTCTRRTILDIYKARGDYRNDGELKAKSLDEKWEKLEKFYVAISQKVPGLKLQNTEPMPAQFDKDGLRKFLREWQEVDTLSSDEVIKSNILKGITEDGLKEFAKGVDLKPGLLHVLQSFKVLNIPFYVISLNFSKKLIEDVLNRAGTLPLIVHANKLTFENGLSTGAMDEKFLSAFDKEILFQRIVQNANQECGVSVYIGDSYNDLLALLEADVGFIIGQSKSMLQTCHNFGILVKPYQWSCVHTRLGMTGSEKSPPVLFSVQSWDEIKDFIFALE